MALHQFFSLVTAAALASAGALASVGVFASTAPSSDTSVLRDSGSGATAEGHSEVGSQSSSSDDFFDPASGPLLIDAGSALPGMDRLMPLDGRASSTAITDESPLAWEAGVSSPERLSSPATSARPSGQFDWPTSSTTVLRKFDHLEHNWLSGHRGVDLASRPGEQIRAAGPGRVAHVGLVVDNNVVSIEHDTGLRTTYLPVTPSVEVGDLVSTGDVIGTIEEGHCLFDTCLHWGAKRGDRYYDPLSLLDMVTIRLYPTDG